MLLPNFSRLARPGARALATALVVAGGLTPLSTPPSHAAEASVSTPANAMTFANGEAARATSSHAYAAYGQQPKYPRGFVAFDFVDADAPKGGTLQIQNPDRRTSFDKFNPFTIKGQSPAGLTTLMFEPLAIRSGDEPGTIYGLVADEVTVAPDKSSVTFRINPAARFTNGDPVTTEDVKHAYDMLTSAAASPAVRSNFDGVQGATVIDARTIRFDLKDRSVDSILNVAGLAVFSHKWGLGADGKYKPFDQIVTEYPITTGPYTIARTDSGRRIEFARDPKYWARDLGVSRGQYNFDRIVYRYYQDNAVALEAFKAGEFDLLVEYSARRWVRQHAGPKWNDGRIVKQMFPNGFGAGLQSYVINIRRPKLADRRVREALNYAYDFEALNVYKQYKRTYSIFANSEFAMTETPSPGELALLEPFRSELPSEVFGPAWKPLRTDTGPNALRENLKKARALLEQAGWKVGNDGLLRNAKGEIFELEYLETGDPGGKAEALLQRNLQRLGIVFKARVVDFALFRKRLETFDFDLVTIRQPDFTIPSAADLKALYGSENADVEGSNNFRGVKSRAVDHILAAMEKAQTLEELRDATRALDRVVIFQFYQIPDLFSGSERVSRWDKFGIPRVVPRYFTIATPSDWMQWAITGWWAKDLQAKDAQGKASPGGARAEASPAGTSAGARN